MGYQAETAHGVCTGGSSKAVAQQYPSHIKPLPGPRLIGIASIPQAEKRTQLFVPVAEVAKVTALIPKPRRKRRVKKKVT